MGDRARRNSKGNAGPSGNLEALMLEIETRQNARFDKLLEGLNSNTAEIKEVKNLISEKEKSILAEVRERDSLTNARIDQLSEAIATATSKGAKQTEIYLEHRRALRLWPVQGNEIRPALFKFFKEQLKIPPEDVCKMGNISIKKHRDPASKNKDEVLVLFESRQTRDLVKAAAKNLANNPSAGMRLHIPAHLEANFKVLQSLGYHLKQSDASIKRSIKFDDEHEDLAMDIKVGETWSRIRPAEARLACDSNPEIYSGPKELSASNISELLTKKNPATGANATPRQ